MPDSFDDRFPGGSADRRFDRWLSWRLHDAYDSVLKEKLPADLQRLVELLGQRDAETGPDGEEADEPPAPARGGAGCVDLAGHGRRSGRAPGAMLMAPGGDAQGD